MTIQVHSCTDAAIYKTQLEQGNERKAFPYWFELMPWFPFLQHNEDVIPSSSKAERQEPEDMEPMKIPQIPSKPCRPW